MRPPLQELARDWGPPSEYGWRVLVVCVLCNLTPGARADPVAREIFRRWPSPAELAAAREREVEAVVRPLGLVRRAETLRELSAAWVEQRRRAEEPWPWPEMFRPRFNPLDLPGVGPYAADAYLVFVEGREDVVPADRVLREWVSLVRRQPRDPPDTTRFGTSEPTPTNENGDTDMATTSTTTTTDEQVTPITEQPTLWAFVMGAGLPKVGPRVADKAFADADLVTTVEPTAEQRMRVATWQDVKPGLAGRALVLWVLTGESAGNGAAKAKAADEKKAEAAKAAPKKTASSKATKYPPEITEAVRLAKAARGTTNGAPGAKQHVLVRTEVGEGATAAEILKASGVKSEKALRAIADGSSDRDEIKVLHPLAAKFADPFCKGRNLASILVAMVTQAKAAK